MSVVACLDLDAVDECKAKTTAERTIAMSGTYAGYTYRVRTVVVEDGARFVLLITPRQGSLKEASILSEWRERLLGRVRGALTEIREEYELSQCPQCNLHGDKV